MSFENEKVYIVVAKPNIKLGYIYDNDFYGTHYSERGPIPLENLKTRGFSIGSDKIVREKDNEVFDVNESSEEEFNNFLNAKKLLID